MRGHRRGERLGVALAYSPAEEAPRVLASARGSLAERLELIAREHGVEIYRDADLAAALFALDAGSAVPPELYRAVAEVLAYCYRINERLKDKLAE
ncbi:MAG TPA: EscU/YscU/HrcU family type III secretion system export apparatus switch protein [Spirochaetota bacterium]|nr:EscU/YscU/HrcU family type III secretion system export apparatus switch protein [Spirochaetota bacterium]OPZ38628.1 MAG: Flagellar biosynthetic protein FlhB [Spirochaetes bacterium ADurb.BinA120]HNU90655.1 EscU/YscU/HrcU family type III secretion system export apparatus switch protein [Spirochaetota bacterium]HPI15695.1 EscU/YscU/HrcU family type III secretion system export apparatus switch protein [Spirochaetota bacterium]HPO46519.1 EscU/YscU/HrcU family type III secretion system export app